MTKITFPLLLVNFKTYPQGTGKKALHLAKICEKVMTESGICVAAAVQATDIHLIASSVEIPVLAQHIDSIKPGSNTGHILAEAIKEAGAIGTLVNHSERRIKLSEIDTILQIAKEKNFFKCLR